MGDGLLGGSKVARGRCTRVLLVAAGIRHRPRLAGPRIRRASGDCEGSRFILETAVEDGSNTRRGPSHEGGRAHGKEWKGSTGERARGLRQA